MPSTYVTVAIPYVNARPHLGYAYELVQADVAARARRLLGDDVRLHGGTDDHSLKNVLAADQAGIEVASFVRAGGERFTALADHLAIGFDDFLRTSSDPRHPPAVRWTWEAARRSGDLYEDLYRGRYCIGCEDFYDESELVDGRCREHTTPAEEVEERNWFFRLSKHAPAVRALIDADRLRIRPEPFRREVLAFLAGDVRDISVSRSASRARGWGIPVPGDDGQVVYVWFDALTSYLAALGLGTRDGSSLGRWWHGADERIHVIGKGILRFHAVYWPAFLLSAGLPLPTEIRVHPYLTADGTKLSKSAGPAGLDVAEALELVGVDGLRWWFARRVHEVVDTDVSAVRLVSDVDDDLANTVGNVVHRVAALNRRRADPAPAPRPAHLGAATWVDGVLRSFASFEHRSAATRILDAASEINRSLEERQPWRWAGDPSRAEELDGVLAEAVAGCAALARAIAPVAPGVAERIAAHLSSASAGAAPAVFARRGQRHEGHTPTRSSR